MPSKIIAVDGLGNVEFPDTMSDDDISLAIKQQLDDQQHNAVATRAFQRYDRLTKEAALPPPPPSPEDQFTWYRDLNIYDPRTAYNMYVGAGKGIIDTATGLFRKHGGDLDNALEGENFPQKAGKFGERVAEFASGDALAAKAIESVPLLSKLPQLGKAVLGGAASGAAVTALEGGGKDDVVTNFAIGGLGPIVGAGIGKVAGALGKRIELTLIKATKADLEDGFKVDTVFKNKLGGSLESTAKKIDRRMESLLDQQKAALTGGPLAGANAAPTTPTEVDLNAVLKQAEADLTGEIAAGRHVRFSDRIPAILDQYRARLRGVGQSGVVDVPTANRVKTGVGDAGAWQFGRPDPDAAAEEVVANKLYSKLRAEIELNSAPELSKLNRQIQELIPVRRAIIRRMPVEARNRIVSLPEVIELAHGRFGLFLLDRALKSGKVANALVRGGGFLGDATQQPLSAFSRAAASLRKPERDAVESQFPILSGKPLPLPPPPPPRTP